jgi:hypothetical protein
MTPVERVRRLVVAGAVAPEEGDRLVAAMAREPIRSPVWVLVNPFDRFGGVVAVAIGVVASVLSVCVTRLGIRFDGFLDLHVARAHVAPLGVSVIEQLAGWLLPAFLFWAYARIFARHVRPLDFLGMIGLARLPTLLAALPIALLSPEQSGLPTRLTPALLAVVFIGLACFGWNITLLYQGFKNASGLRGPKLVFGMVAMVIVAEAASKLVLAFVS